uniref:Inhibitor of nuclear factor kappa B kinase subunit epsilon n=1 Tax=Neogobius melanostomus TaxID=47308 RepID=A0A8C6TCN4_9GOBI
MASTANYLWSLQDLLGQGATASVYKARNKKTGELVAVKVFNGISYNRPHEVQMREFELLRKLNHNNIIRLHAVEELPSKQKVLVMEYCPGGSLLNVLEDPENAFGLAESEFLTVLQCVVQGMNHLRENGVVHRDIKPGNIMRQVGEDGRSVYKLTDFGAARELEDNEKFMSIYGTEEYLHPDMYERAVLKKPHQKSYGVNVDLWSIGVTFYHAATGTLPFMPYGGPRKNKPTMFKITTEKPTGAIAGVQRRDGGPIEWSYQGLRAQLVPVLAGILEADEEKCWGFDQFFTATTNVLQRLPVHLFSLQQATEHCVYVHHYSTVSVFLEEVCSQTGVSPQQQLLLHLGHELPLEANMKVVNLPRTTPQRPLMLLSYTPDKNCSLPFREPESPVIPSKFDVIADYSFTKAMVGVIHQYLRITRMLHLHRDLLLQGYYSYMPSSQTHWTMTRGTANSTVYVLPKVTLQTSLFGSVQKMEILQQKIVAVHHQFRKDRMVGKLPYNDEQIHKFEKIQLASNIKRVKLLFREDCLLRYKDLLSATRPMSVHIRPAVWPWTQDGAAHERFLNKMNNREGSLAGPRVRAKHGEAVFQFYAATICKKKCRRSC